MFHETLLFLFSALNLILLVLFLTYLHSLFQRFKPLIDKFVSKSGSFKLPTWREALGVGLMKLIEGLDVSKMLPGWAKK